MKNIEKKLLTEILRVQELMGVKQLINENEYEPVLKWFKSLLHISEVDKEFATMFKETFDHIKVNDSELAEKIKKSLGANDLSIEGLQGLNKITNIKSSELKGIMEDLQKQVISFIFNKYTDDFIKLSDTMIESGLQGKPNLKAAYDHMVGLAEKGEAQELQSSIENARKMNIFPSYVLDHIQNTKFIQKAEDTVIDTLGKAGDDLIDAVGGTLEDSTKAVSSGLKVVGGKIVGLTKLLIKGAKSLSIENLLDGITDVFPNFSKTTFIRGYKGLAGTADHEVLRQAAEGFNIRFANLIQNPNDQEMKILEQDLTKYLNDSNRWLLTSQKQIITYWKTNLSQICTESGIPNAVDRFFGEIESNGTTKSNTISPKFKEAINLALEIEGKPAPISYVGILDGYKRMLPIVKSWRSSEGSAQTFFQRFGKFLSYGDPRLFSETADNIIYTGGLKGYMKKEAKRRILFAFVYWFTAYTIQDFAKAYVLGTKDEKSWLYNTFLSWGWTPNTKYPENIENDTKFDIYMRWLGMAFINYWGINSKKLSDSYIGALTGIKGDKEWETLNTPTADELEKNPEIAKEKLNRRGNWKNKFFESPLWGILNWLDYQNAGSAQTGVEAKVDGYIQIQLKDFENDPNLPTDTVQRKIAVDSMRTALQNAKILMRKYMDSAESDFGTGTVEKTKK